MLYKLYCYLSKAHKQKDYLHYQVQLHIVFLMCEKKVMYYYVLIAPDKGSNTREKISNTVDDFLKKHNIKLKRKDVGDLVDDLEEAAD